MEQALAGRDYVGCRTLVADDRSFDSHCLREWTCRLEHSTRHHREIDACRTCAGDGALHPLGHAQRCRDERPVQIERDQPNHRFLIAALRACAGKPSNVARLSKTSASAAMRSRLYSTTEIVRMKSASRRPDANRAAPAVGRT